MGMIKVLFIILIWAIPIFYIINTYIKTDKEEQQEFKNEMKSPSFLLIGGFSCIGVLLFHSGNIATIKSLEHIGAFMVFFGWFSGCIAFWEKSVKKSVGLMSLGVMGVVTYCFLVI
ncbi:MULTISPECIES: hypothetical protein [unclassified Mesobacillus]|uniref:hypothetical protein n=1 Tax=unclassified Mesobacillus TaxID=2675270 RepID=UPI00203E57D7|nr:MULTISPECIES: hypothetical protein [unclassified Mesobacillus]MCM3124501.1 hypothetical protein [Mesobacillus sp. MER 33]MCM3234789.1 hypothetical protein [Mesobacillus sp. MER 48]